MVYVPAGAFQMGSEGGEGNERPVHTVTLDAFWIDRTEVTNAQYKKCVAAGVCRALACADCPDFNGDTQPVVSVDWNDAQTYCAWAGRALPTEAQWEKAARGTDGWIYPWGNVFGKRLNFADFSHGEAWSDKTIDDGYRSTAPVGSYPAGASPYGALDMAGNVWEWVADWYDANYYLVSPSTNPTGPISGQARMLCGGSWINDKNAVRTANRDSNDPLILINIVGFRCASSGSEP